MSLKSFMNEIRWPKVNIRNLLAVVVVFSITGIIILGHYKAIPEVNKELISGAVNQYLVVGFAVVIAYFFVASKNDSDWQKHNQQIDVLKKVPLTELLGKCKDVLLERSERESWFKKLQDQYPEYAGVKLDD